MTSMSSSTTPIGAPNLDGISTLEVSGEEYGRLTGRILMLDRFRQSSARRARRPCKGGACSWVSTRRSSCWQRVGHQPVHLRLAGALGRDGLL